MRNGLIDSHVNRELDAFRAAVCKTCAVGVSFGCIFALGLLQWGFVLRSLALNVGSTGAPLQQGAPFVKLNHTR